MKRAFFSPEGFLFPPFNSENGRSPGRLGHHRGHPPLVVSATVLSPHVSMIAFAPLSAVDRACASILLSRLEARAVTIASLPAAPSRDVAVVVVFVIRSWLVDGRRGQRQPSTAPVFACHFPEGCSPPEKGLTIALSRDAPAGPLASLPSTCIDDWSSCSGHRVSFMRRGVPLSHTSGLITANCSSHGSIPGEVHSHGHLAFIGGDVTSSSIQCHHHG